MEGFIYKTNPLAKLVLCRAVTVEESLAPGITGFKYYSLTAHFEYSFGVI